jgi:hypothetical protein
MGEEKGRASEPQLLTTPAEEVRMGQDSDTTTDTGLTSLRAFAFLILWYFFSGRLGGGGEVCLKKWKIKI